MKVLHVAWGYLPQWGGGLLMYAESLMARQAALGHQVSYFCAGRYDFRGGCYVRKWGRNGVAIFELVNAPNTPYAQTNPLTEISEPAAERHFSSLLADLTPDVVHVHSFIGLSASVIDLSREHGSAVVLTLHDYHPVCPTIFLFNYRHESCRDYQAGQDCVRCKLGQPSPSAAVRAARLRFALARVPLVKSFLPLARWGASLARRLRTKRGFVTGRTASYPAESYVIRRREFVSRLNRADLLLANSRRLAEIFAAHGVDTRKLITLHLSLPSLSFLRPKPPSSVSRPLTFCYLNSVDESKGACLLVRAFTGIDRGKARLVFHGYGRPEYIQELKRLTGGADVSFLGPYRHEDLPEILKGVDVGIVPSAREEPYGFVGVEFLCAGIPVIGSRRGGIPEYVHDSVNGFLFDPDEPDVLRRKILRFIEEPGLIQQLTKNIQRPEEFADHVRRLEALYLEALDSRARRVALSHHA